MAASIETASNPPTRATGEPSARGTKQTAGVPASESARKRAVRRGANVHIQDEDQAPTGKNAGDTHAAIEAARIAASEGTRRGSKEAAATG